MDLSGIIRLSSSMRIISVVPSGFWKAINLTFFSTTR